MKRTVVFLCVICCLLLSLTACSKVAVYQKGSMSITLPREFVELNPPDYTVCYNSEDVTIFVLREAVKDMTLTEYAASVYEANAWLSPDPITIIDGLTVMEYSYKNQAAQATIRYFATMFESSDDSFWLIQFSCDQADYEQYRPQFIEWAKTVSFKTESQTKGE